MGQTLTSAAFTIELGGSVAINGVVKTAEDDTAKPVLILSHGFRGFKDWGFWPFASTYFAEHGFYVISFDFSRISVKNGNFDEAALHEAFAVSKELSDLDAILEHLKAKELPLPEQADTNRIAVLGHSRAGSSNIVFASEHDEIGALITFNAAANVTPQGDGAQETVIKADLEKTPERFRITARLASFQGSALIIQGEQDSERLIEGHQQLRQAAPKQTYVSIPDADHTFGVSHPFSEPTPALSEALQTSLAFLQNWRQR